MIRGNVIGKRKYLDTIIRDKRVTAAQKELLRLLLDQRSEDGTVEPRVHELMDYFNLTQTAVYNRIRMAVRNGYLREMPGPPNRQRVYEFTLPDQPEDVASIGARLSQVEASVSAILERLGTVERELAEARASVADSRGERSGGV